MHANLIPDRSRILTSINIRYVAMLMLLCSLQVNAEVTQTFTTIEIKGRITDENNEPIAGVSVVVKGNRKGTVTDARGCFVLTNIHEEAMLIISATNIESREVKVNGRRDLSDITVKMKPGELEAVVVNKGYYTERQKVSTSNVVTVSAAEIERQPVQNPLLALQGRVPGLMVTQPSGISGTPVKAQIQGKNSIRNGTQPLYVIDGIPIDADLQSTGVDGVLGSPGSGAGNFPGHGHALNYINPADIESIDILKDADATAIYGSRAANGAILITTKKGKPGPAKFDLNMQSGIGRVARRINMMNTRQYLDMRYEAFRNDQIDWRSPSVQADDLKVWDTTRYTDWQKELLGNNAHYSDVNASVSGGNSMMRYLVSGSYHKETTVFPFHEFADTKAGLHFGINSSSSNQKFRMQVTGNFIADANKLPQTDITQTALLMEPNAPSLLNADGSINWAPDANGKTTLGGPDINVMVLRLQRYENKTYNLLSSLQLDYTVLSGFNIGSSAGYNYMQTNDYVPYPLSAVAPELRSITPRAAHFGERNIQSWILEPHASYQAKISKGSLEIFIGGTFHQRLAASNAINATGQLSDELLKSRSAASALWSTSENVNLYRYNALLGRVNYNWNDKYIVNINARRDGSTRFGPNNRFNNFGSVGVAWIFSNENFFTPLERYISFGKFKGSYGMTGSDQIDDYQYLSFYKLDVFAAVPYQGIVGLRPSGAPNPGLQWEETRKLQLGIDVGLLHERVVVNATYVNNRSSSQIMFLTMPSQTGFDSYLANFPALVQNTNWELVLTGKLMQKKHLSWTSSINVTLPRNKLINFADLAASNYWYSLRIGEPIDNNAYYHWLGVDPATGQYLFVDRNGNPTPTPTADDRTVQLSRFPKMYGGLINSISYKQVQLDFVFQFVQQTGYNDLAIFNGLLYRFPGMFHPAASNQPVTLLDRWQRPGDNNRSVAKYSTEMPSLDVISSDRRFADASYIRLKNVSLSWTLPKKWIRKARLSNGRIYLHAQNVLTITRYKGLDPETQSSRSLPPLQVWTVGIQLGFAP